MSQRLKNRIEKSEAREKKAKDQKLEPKTKH